MYIFFLWGNLWYCLEIVLLGSIEPAWVKNDPNKRRMIKGFVLDFFFLFYLLLVFVSEFSQCFLFIKICNFLFWNLKICPCINFVHKYSKFAQNVDMSAVFFFPNFFLGFYKITRIFGYLNIANKKEKFLTVIIRNS